MHVQHELRQRPVQSRDGPAHEGKARARQLGRGLEVQAQGLAQIDVVAHGKVEGTRPVTMRTPAAHLDVGALVGAHRHAGVRQVGHGQQQRVQLGLDGVQPRGRGVQLVLDAGHAGHHVVGRFALGLALADLLAGGVALGLQGFGAGLDGLALALQRGEGGFVQIRLRILAGGQTRQHGAQVLAEQNGIKHGAIVGVAGARQPQAKSKRKVPSAPVYQSQ